MPQGNQNLDVRDQALASLLSRASGREGDKLSPDEQGDRDGTVAAEFLREKLKQQLDRTASETF